MTETVYTRTISRGHTKKVNRILESAKDFKLSTLDNCFSGQPFDGSAEMVKRDLYDDPGKPRMSMDSTGKVIVQYHSNHWYAFMTSATFDELGIVIDSVPRGT